MSKVVISISINLEELMLIENMAAEIGVSRSSMTRILLRKGLEVNQNNEKNGEH